jgi:hypothetical protein
MARRRMRLVGVVVVGACLCTWAHVHAQDEQWLQYRSSQDASAVVGGIGRTEIKLSTTVPPDLSVPKFKDSKPLYGKWMTPMAKAGFLWLALERSTSKGSYDRLIIDTNANGRLDDETSIKAYRSDPDQARFGPVKVVLQGDDGPVSFHLDLLVYSSGQRVYCLVAAAGWYEGDVTIDGTKTHCALIDYTGNGAFNDTSTSPYQADRIILGDREAGGQPSAVGRFIDVNGTLYELEVAKDGACVKFKQAADVRFGQIHVGTAISRLTASGTNGQFRLTPKDQVVRVPVGRYCVTEWAIDRKDDKGRPWTALAETRGASDRLAFDVAEDREASVDIGEPFVSHLTVRNTGDNHSFSQQLEGRLGEQITISQGGNDRPGPPKVRIKDKDGAYDRTLTFAYG